MENFGALFREGEWRILVHFLEKENGEYWCTFYSRRLDNAGTLFREGDLRMLVLILEKENEECWCTF